MAVAKVLFIAGCWRSGSTLLGDALGGLPGYAHTGEMHHVWSRGLTMNWRCGCGDLFRDCRFWGPVMAPWMDESGARAAELERTRRRMMREMTSVKWCEGVCREWPDYIDEVRLLLQRVFEASDASAVIDSSKSFRQACMLLATGEVALYVVHLVRDPRTTVYSLVHRAKRHLDDPLGSAMVTLEPNHAIDYWLESNRQTERLVDLPGVEYLRVRYEDFVAKPGETLQRLSKFAGVSAEGLQRGGPPEIVAGHSISGNPDRLLSGARRQIRAVVGGDGLDPGIRALVESRTGEALEAYGYRLG